MRLLIAEDSESLCRSLRHGLERSGWQIDVAGDGQQALDLLVGATYDALLLDLMLPVKSGLLVLQELRRRGNGILTLVLSARDRVEDRVQALEMGADDYMVKPFSFDELAARLRALRRRRYARTGPKFRLGKVEVNLEAMRAQKAGSPIHLTPGELAVLELLLLRRGQVVTREKILQEAHPHGEEVGSNVVEVLVSHLRRKLSADGSLIQTRRGLGYIIE